MHASKLLFHGLLALGIAASGSTALAAKRVVVDKGSQTLRAYEDGQLVFQSRVSTGKQGKDTPNGTFRAQMKKRMHYSSRYNNAPMPYSVQYSGNYFIHGYSQVPNYPASRGCVRMPVGAAAAFYNWVTPGTPISVTGHWSGPKKPSMQSSKRQRRVAATRQQRRHQAKARPARVAERTERAYSHNGY